MVDLSRRGMLGMTVGAVAAGPTAAKAVAAHVGEALNAPLPPIAQRLVAGSAGGATADVAIERSSEWLALRQIHDSLRERRRELRNLRVRGLDADIAALRLPRVTQVRMQLERDAAADSVLERIAAQLWPRDGKDRNTPCEQSRRY